MVRAFAKWLLGDGTRVDWLTWWGHGVQSVWIMLVTAFVLAGNFEGPGAWRVPLAAGAMSAGWVFLHRELSNFADATTSAKRKDKVLDWLLGAIVAVLLTALAWRFGFGLWFALGLTVAYLGTGLVVWRRS